jgi:hypothetical protein
MSSGADASFEAAVLRIYGRYVREVVEAYSFCPWALKAREDGKVCVRVCPSADWDLPWAVEATESIARTDGFDIGILIFPRLSVQFRAFGQLVTELRDAHGEQHPEGKVPMAMAPFHPDGGGDISTAGRLTSFVRRSPDPTIQLVRRSVLDEIRRNERRGTDYIDLESANLEALLAEPVTTPIHQRILEANQDTLEAIGTKAVEAVLASIHEDRERSYRDARG